MTKKKKKVHVCSWGPWTSSASGKWFRLCRDTECSAMQIGTLTPHTPVEASSTVRKAR